MRTTLSRSTGSAPLLLAILLLGVPVASSLGYLLVGTLGGLGAGAGAQGAWGAVLRDPVVWRSLAFSLWYAGAGTVLALLLALALVLVVGRSTAGGRVAQAIALLPLPVPPLAGAVATLLLLGQSGWLARVAHAAGWISAPGAFPALVLDPAGVGMIVAIAWKETPFLVLVAGALLATRGPMLLEAGRTHGASSAQAVRTLVLPMLLRGLAPSVLAVFVFVFGSLELALVLAPSRPMALPVLMQEDRQSLQSLQQAAGYVVALLGAGVALALTVLHEWLRAREEG